MKTQRADKPQNFKITVYHILHSVLQDWLILFADGLLLFSVGLWVIYSPFGLYLNLSFVFAAGIAATGIADIIFAWKNRHHKRWIWWLLVGIADIIIGSYLFTNTLITIILLPIIISLWTIYKALMSLGDALHIRAYSRGNWRRLLFIAVVALVMATLLLACTLIGIENIFLFSGVAFVSAGLFRIFWALKLRQLMPRIRNQEEDFKTDTIC
ncbi:MAG: DUF308 domain-containing protein [Bacteroidota bacterium]